MIKSIVVTNPKGESLELVLTRPELSGLAVTKIDGLGPPTANINTTEMATMDGGLLSGTKAQTRNIVLYLRMFSVNNVFTIEDCRQLTYKYFPIKKQITFRVITDNRDVQIEGYVESNKPDIFSSKESCQISIICPQPYFHDANETLKVCTGVVPMFEFPFSNESTTQELLVMSEILVETRTHFEYYGDVDTGMLITCEAKNDVKNIVLYDSNTNGVMRIDTELIKTMTGRKFSTMDALWISTVSGNKYVRLLRDGQFTNVIYAINKDAEWFSLTTGTNEFGFACDEGELDLYVSFRYRNAYGGI